jgi:hypothetical protein
MGGAFALALIMIFFWMPETAFVRTGVINLDTGSNNVCLKAFFSAPYSQINQIMTEVNLSHKMPLEHLEGEKGASDNIVRSPSPSQEEPHSFYKDLLPYSGYVNHVSFFNTIFRPFVLLGSPAVLWATLLFTTCISWLVGISITLSQIFSAPPYNFSVSAVGLTNLSAFVASLLGTLIAGPTIDGLVRRMSKMNGGTFGKLYPRPHSNHR